MIYETHYLKLFLNKEHFKFIDVNLQRSPHSYYPTFRKIVENDLVRESVSIDRADITQCFRSDRGGLILELDCGMGLTVECDIYSSSIKEFLKEIHMKDTRNTFNRVLDISDKKLFVCTYSPDFEKHIVLGVCNSYDAELFSQYRKNLILERSRAHHKS